MEEALGQIILNSWVEIRTLYLQHIRHHLTTLGACVAIFSRDKYQSKSGNTFHEHFVMAVDRSSMGPEAEELVQDLLRTSVMEVLKTDELQ